MAAVSELSQLLAQLRPHRRPGRYVLTTLSDGRPGRLPFYPAVRTPARCHIPDQGYYE